MKELINQTIGEFYQQTRKHHDIVWNELKNKKFLNKQFIKHHPIILEDDAEKSVFITDFYCPEHNLIIELDEGIHTIQPNYFKIREKLVDQQKYRVLHFSNEQIANELNEVIVRLGQHIIGLHLQNN